jgi:hypothetical protein
MKNLLRQMIYKIILGLYITYETLVITAVILAESISGVFERRQVRKEKQNKNRTGKDIMVHVQN